MCHGFNDPAVTDPALALMVLVAMVAVFSRPGCLTTRNGATTGMDKQPDPALTDSDSLCAFGRRISTQSSLATFPGPWLPWPAHLVMPIGEFVARRRDRYPRHPNHHRVVQRGPDVDWPQNIELRPGFDPACQDPRDEVRSRRGEPWESFSRRCNFQVPRRTSDLKDGDKDSLTRCRGGCPKVAWSASSGGLEFRPHWPDCWHGADSVKVDR